MKRQRTLKLKSTTLYFTPAAAVLAAALASGTSACGSQSVPVGYDVGDAPPASAGSGTTTAGSTNGGSTDVGGDTSTSAGSTATGGGASTAVSVPVTVGNGGAGSDDCGNSGSTAVTSPPDLNAACDGVAALTGQAVLDALQPKYLATLAYEDGTSTQLTIATHYAGGPVTCPGANSSMEASLAKVDLEVQFDVATADGAFQESFAAPLTFDGSSPLSFYGYLPASCLKGTYKPTLSGAPLIVVFAGSLSKTTSNGSVIQQTTGNPGQGAAIGSWK
jgi:hypothetical protein